MISTMIPMRKIKWPTLSLLSFMVTVGVNAQAFAGTSFYLSPLLESENALQMATQQLNLQNCNATLTEIAQTFQSISNTTAINLGDLQQNGEKILNNLFQARAAIHQKLESLHQNPTCVEKIRDVFQNIRSAEDMTGALFYQDKQISSTDLGDFQLQPTPIYQADQYHPMHAVSSVDLTKKFEFKSGDVLITKGFSFTSSTISTVTPHVSSFSHLVLIHVDDKTKKVSTIESYIGAGVKAYDIEYALKNENARILIFRPKNQELAKKAADYMYNRVIEAQKQGKVIPYDYTLNFEDNSRLSCEAVIVDAFKTASGKQMIVPEVTSKISHQDEKFLNKVGMKNGNLMVPSDLEVDFRFELLLEWSDFRTIRDSSRKDIVIESVFKMMDEKQYRIHSSFKSSMAYILWATRYIPGVWSLSRKLMGLPKGYAKDVPSSMITAMAGIKDIGIELLKFISAADQEHFARNQVWMSRSEMAQALEDFRVEDLKRYQEGRDSKFHKLFRPVQGID